MTYSSSRLHITVLRYSAATFQTRFLAPVGKVSYQAV